ncbi:MAG: xanthine dehydrogenase family protein molybdopterin-binding subunit, partial [Chloroflexi bacterium]|nr:xanthine dehydrogenase family protein molybdopterin-binding subunit [Chloroflexota bacterium]
MTTTADRKTAEQAQHNGQYKVVGTRPIRHDGLDKVTGRAKYGADIQLAGLLHGKVLRSPHAHARIKSIDFSKALRVPGVKAVVTAADIKIISDQPMDLGETGMLNARMLAEICLASKKVLYKGHAVAAVAADNPHVAEEALKLIAVDYEVLKPVLTLEEALKKDAPLLHEEMTTRNIAARFDRGSDTGVRSNIGSHLQFKRGDVEQGFTQADVVVEREFRTKMVHQGYIEPHTATVFWSLDGHITIWTSTQAPFIVRDQVAAILSVPESVVKVVPMEIGGGFGGKISAYLDPVAALLSKKTGRPVKMTMSRREVFEASGPTSGTIIRCKIGAKKDGAFTAAKMSLMYEAGCIPGSPMGGGSNTGLAPYKLDNLLVEGDDVVLNKPKVAAYRAPGSAAAAFAVECVIDELAQKLGIDPIDLRLKNAAQEGDRTPAGPPHPVIGLKQLLETMKSHPHCNAPLTGPNRGRGVSVGYWMNAGFNSSATISVNGDGTITMVTGSVDIGGTRASLAMQAAEVLGLTAADVIPSVGDTDSVGWTHVTGGSRVTFATGLAVIEAAENVKRQMLARAALLWEVKPEEVEFRDGTFVCSKDPSKYFTFKGLAAKLMSTGGPVTASASSNPKKVGPAFAGNLVDVQVDPETGKVDVLRFTVFQDAGKAAHPSYVEGQMQGGAVQGVGWALNEEYVFNPDGSMANPTF